MANSTIPGLVAVSVPALTDLLGVRQSGDARDKKLTVTQLLSLAPGGGDVTKVGTPVDNQLGIWTGDGTIEGDSNLRWDGTQLLVPQSAVTATPTIAFGDGDTGIFEFADDLLAFAINGGLQYLFSASTFGSSTSSGALMRASGVSLTVPSLIPRVSDTNTGIGSSPSADDELVLISGSIAGLRLAELNSGVIQVPDADLLITAFATGGQANAVQLNKSYNVLSTVATTGDSVKLPVQFLINSIVYVKNNGANAADLFPAVGDNLGAGLNVAVSLPAGEGLVFIATAANNVWTQLLVDTAGSGDVVKVGTPVDNQLGVWTGDGTLEGTTALQFDGNTFTMNLGGGDLRLTGKLELQGSNRPAILDEAASNINPTLVPSGGAPNSGIGGAGAVTLVADGRIGHVVTQLNASILAGYQSDVSITAFATGGQANAVILGSSYNVLSTVATTGDSVKLPVVFEAGNPATVIYIKNDGANAADVFPGSGDDLGAGVDTAESLAAGTSVSYIATAGSTWTKWIVSPSGGDVFKVGTPSAGQFGVWTGDGTIEGISEMTLGGGVFNMNPGTETRVTGNLRLLTGSGQAPALLDVLADETTPTLIPAFGDQNTGIGWRSADRLSLISGGKAGLILAESNSIGVIPAWDIATSVTAFATGGQASAVVMDFGYNIVTTVATTGDSVKLPTGLGFLSGAVVYVKNSGANACDLFPGVGDDLGAGTNIAISVAAGTTVAFIGLVADVTWTQIIFAAGGGDVTKVGTPANNQLGVWTGDGTIEGDANWQVVGTALQGVLGSGPEMRNVGGVNIHPRKGDTDTGIASRGDNRLGLVAQGIDGIKLIGASSAILQQHNTTVGLTAFAGGGAASATQLNSSYSVIDTVATTGDSVKFSTTLEVGVVNYVKNDGANALDLFPAAGDDLGLGVGVAISVGAGKSVAFIGTVTGSTSTQFIFAEEGGSFPLLAPDGSAAAPSYSFSSDSDTGIFLSNPATMEITTAGVSHFEFNNTAFGGKIASGPRMLDEAPTATNPNLVPNKADTDSGIGQIAANTVSFIAGGAEAFRATFAGGGRAIFAAAAGPLASGIPPITVVSDLNTGIYFPAADQMTLHVGGVDLIRLVEGAGDQVIVAPILQDAPATPSLAFGDGDTGFYENADDFLSVAVAGVRRFVFTTTAFQGVTSGAAQILDEVASATNPTLIPHNGNDNTGIGRAAADQLSLIAGGVEMLRASEGVTDQLLIGPNGTAAAPALSFISDPDTGLYSVVPGIIAMSVDGTDRFRWVGDQFRGASGGSPSIQNEVASATNPTLLPSQTDLDTGIGRTGTDQLALIAGALDCMTVRETGGARQVGFYVTAPISLQTGVAVSAAAIHAALVALGLITA